MEGELGGEDWNNCRYGMSLDELIEFLNKRIIAAGSVNKSKGPE